MKKTLSARIDAAVLDEFKRRCRDECYFRHGVVETLVRAWLAADPFLRERAMREGVIRRNAEKEGTCRAD